MRVEACQDGHMTPTIKRRLVAWLASVALVAAVTVVIKLVHPQGPSRGLAVIYIVVVLSVAVRWGPGYAFVASLLSAAAFDYFFLTPGGFAVPALADGEAVAAFLVTAIVASLLASRLRRQVGEAARLAREQAALRRIASLVARAVPPTGVFSELAEEVGLLFGVELAVLARRDPDGMSTVLAHWGAVGALGCDVPAGSRWPPAGPPTTTSDTGIRSSIVSPIVIEGRPWGFILVATRNTPLSDDAAQQVADFGELLATAIRNTENQAELKSSRARVAAAGDETRRRIERNLHDGAQQRLVCLALSVRAVQASVPPERAELRAELEQVAAGLVSVQDELRELSHGLHPAVLSKGGLRPALKALARRSPIPVELEVGVERLPQQVEVTAYFVVSELLTNAAKHAQATAVHVVVDVRDKVLLLSVRDDGIGGADPALGSGLVGVRDRVEAIDGTVFVHSPARAGTSIDVEIPIAA
jgi:signal transduction histidine kinase